MYFSCINAEQFHVHHMKQTLLYSTYELMLSGLRSLPASYLVKLLFFYYTNTTIHLPSKSNTYSELKLKSKMMKTWTKNDIVNHGKENLLFAFNLWQQHMLLIRNSQIAYCVYEVYHVRGRVYALIEHEYEMANRCLVIAACSTDNLYESVVSLAALSHSCYLNGQYLIGKRILKCIYKLCNGYLLPAFVEFGYVGQRKKFNRMIRRLTCSNCKGTDGKLRVCKGCMKMVYCSVLCQKKHWNRIHRTKCGKLSHFKMLENCIIKQLR